MDIFLGLSIFVLIGAFFAFPILLIRRITKNKPRIRVLVIAFFSLAAWIFMYASITYFGGMLSSLFVTMGCGDNFESNNFSGHGSTVGFPCNPPVDYALMEDFNHEMGMRYMMPPPLREYCFTDIPEVCEAADDWLPLHDITWVEYLLGWLISSLTGIPTAIIGWLLTRTTEKTKRKNG